MQLCYQNSASLCTKHFSELARECQENPDLRRNTTCCYEIRNARVAIASLLDRLTCTVQTTFAMRIARDYVSESAGRTVSPAAARVRSAAEISSASGSSSAGTENCVSRD